MKLKYIGYFLFLVFIPAFLISQSGQWVSVSPGFKKVGGNVELVNGGDNVTIAGTTTLSGATTVSGASTFTGASTFGVDGTGVDVIWYSDTVGDSMLYDQSAEALIIQGTAGQNALNIGDGNLSVADNATIGLINVLVDTSTTNDTYGGTITPAPAALVENMVVYVRVGVANTGAATLAFNGLTVKNIKTASGADPANNDMLTASMAILFYNDTNWILLNPATTTD